MTKQPLYPETSRLLQAITDHNIDCLKHLVAPSAHIVDVDFRGNSLALTDPSTWFDYLQHKAMISTINNATCAVAVTDYHSTLHHNLAHTFVHFIRETDTNGKISHQAYVATVVWANITNSWITVSWHCSLANRRALLV